MTKILHRLRHGKMSSVADLSLKMKQTSCEKLLADTLKITVLTTAN